MRLAVTYENGQVFQHFGHTEQMKVFEIKEGQIVSSEVVSTNGSGHGALADFLVSQEVDAVICGGIGGGAKAALANAGIVLYGGVSQDVDSAVADFLQGTLAYNPGVECSHHKEHEHEEGHSCGGNCSSHSCGGNCGSSCGTTSVEMEASYENTDGVVLTLTMDNFDEEVLNKAYVTMIDFWAEWCAPCKMLAPIVMELARELPNVKFAKVNVDSEQQLAAYFGIENIPTLALVKENVVVDFLVGYMEKAEIKEHIAKAESLKI